jgi:elongation factor Tu
MGFLKRLFGRGEEEENPSLYQPERPSYPSERPSFQPEQSSDPFRMTVDDIFNISNRGIVLTGRVESGTLQQGDRIMIANQTTTVETKAVSIESFRKALTTAKTGDNIGILLPGDVPKVVLSKGMIVTKRVEA